VKVGQTVLGAHVSGMSAVLSQLYFGPVLIPTYSYCSLASANFCLNFVSQNVQLVLPRMLLLTKVKSYVLTVVRLSQIELRSFTVIYTFYL